MHKPMNSFIFLVEDSMPFSFKKLENITGRDCFDKEKVWYEISDANGNEIGEIWKKKDDYQIIIYQQEDNISFSLSELENIFNQAKISLNESAITKLENLEKKIQGAEDAPIS